MPDNRLAGLNFLGIRLDPEKDGAAAVSYGPPVGDLAIPSSAEERIAWVRQSYERFIEKVLEKEALSRQIAMELG